MRRLALLAGLLAGWAGAVAHAAAEPASTLILGERSPSYAVQLHAPAGELLVALEVRPEVRSLSLRFSTLELPPGRQLVSVEVFDTPPAENRRPKLRGVLRQVPETEPGLAGGRVLKADFPLQQLRTETFRWFVRLQGEATPEGKLKPASVDLQIESDARPVTDRERELMRWRDRVDPEKNPEAVRALFARLTDEEVRHYTFFPDRAAFLKHWKRTRLRDLQDDRGVVFTRETRPLTQKGNPLPDGRYLHHNGKPLLDD